MAFLKAEETYSVDSKGRINIPVKMRKCIEPEANDTFNVMKGFENCIFAFPLNEWKKHEDKLSELNLH